jgi:hypothetical protein
MMMSKPKNNELKFSIRNLIDTTSSSSSLCEKSKKGLSNPSNGTCHSSTNRSLKHIVIESESSSIPRPIPLFKPIIPPKISHPCWSFLTQLSNKNVNGNIPFNSPLIFLSKMNQVWEQIQRTQISPSITATTTTTTENPDVSDEDMETSHIELDDDDDEEEEEQEGECSSSGGDKPNTTSNSEENDKLKNYPCTQCDKVDFILTKIPYPFFFI